MTTSGTLNAPDTVELARAARTVLHDTVECVLTQLCGPRAATHAIAEIASVTAFDHVATLVFPRTLAEVRNCLEGLGFTLRPPVPSVVVRRRLAERHRVELGESDVQIVRADRPGRPGLEVFCLPATPGTLKEVVALERDAYHERHLALLVEHPSDTTLQRLADLLLKDLGMRADGGGHNPHEDRGAGGRSVLYFRHARGGRLELTCTGHFPAVIDPHLAR